MRSRRQFYRLLKSNVVISPVAGTTYWRCSQLQLTRLASATRDEHRFRVPDTDGKDGCCCHHFAASSLSMAAAWTSGDLCMR